MSLPPAHLFAALEEVMLADPVGPLAVLAASYDPSRGPIGNLPGGRMTPGQRGFVDAVWLRRVRPALVAAGFWRVGTIGQP